MYLAVVCCVYLLFIRFILPFIGPGSLADKTNITIPSEKMISSILFVCCGNGG